MPHGTGTTGLRETSCCLGNAMLSINAVKGFEYGQGFGSMELKGSQQNDLFFNDNGKINVHTNRSGGIQEESAADRISISG